MGNALEDQRKKGNISKGPGPTAPGPREFRSTRPQNHSEAIRSQEVQEDPELLRAGSGPALGSIEVSASLPACVRWEISPRNCLELSTAGPDS